MCKMYKNLSPNVLSLKTHALYNIPDNVVTQVWGSEPVAGTDPGLQVPPAYLAADQLPR